MKIWNNALPKIMVCMSMTLTGLAYAQAPEPIKIGMSTVITGPVVQYGDMHRAAVHAAIAQVNAQGGVLGRQVEVIEFDDACNPGKTAEVAQQIADAGISYVFGPLCSGAIPGAEKIFNEHKIVMITPTGSSDNLSSFGYPIFFRTIGKDQQQATAAAQYIVEHVKPKALAIIYENQAYGKGLAEQANSTVEAGGLKPVFYEEFPKGGTDFTELIGKMKALGVDCIYYAGYHPELIVMMQAAKAQGFAPQWVGPGGVASPAVKGDWVGKLMVTLPPDVSQNPDNAAASQAIKAQGQDPSGSFVMTSYAGAQVMTDAIKGAGTDDRVKVAEFMHGNTFQTVLGEIAFTPEGDNAKARFDIFNWQQDGTKAKVSTP